VVHISLIKAADSGSSEVEEGRDTATGRLLAICWPVVALVHGKICKRERGEREGGREGERER
jgi:hypothetical protein